MVVWKKNEPMGLAIWLLRTQLVELLGSNIRYGLGEDTSVGFGLEVSKDKTYSQCFELCLQLGIITLTCLNDKGYMSNGFVESFLWWRIVGEVSHVAWKFLHKGLKRPLCEAIKDWNILETKDVNGNRAMAYLPKKDAHREWYQPNRVEVCFIRRCWNGGDI